MPISRNDVCGREQHVLWILLRVLGGDKEIKLTSRLVEDLYIDSMSMVELVMLINEFFEIDLPEKDVAQWRVVEDVCTLVKEQCVDCLMQRIQMRIHWREV